MTLTLTGMILGGMGYSAFVVFLLFFFKVATQKEPTPLICHYCDKPVAPHGGYLIRQCPNCSLHGMVYHRECGTSLPTSLPNKYPPCKGGSVEYSSCKEGGIVDVEFFTEKDKDWLQKMKITV